ncbi:hypothetical protein M0R45_032267 [Rubus argutus]|uniref:Uncharacterized protein n=1 Tax=Rubus argutus TaxID=59490 RepID=A0AAW1WIV7_RUBAR
MGWAAAYAAHNVDPPLRTTTAAQPEAQPIQDDHHHPNNDEYHRTSTSTTSSYDILSIIRQGFTIVLLLILILSALLKFISLLKGRDTGPLPIHHAATADQQSQNLSDVMQLQQAPLAPPHPHNVPSLSFTEQISMDADVDHVEIDDV